MAAGSTLVKRVMVQLTADDADAEAKLDAISAKADELAAKNPDLKVKIETAAASAKMAVFRQELAKAATVDAPACRTMTRRTSWPTSGRSWRT